MDRQELSCGLTMRLLPTSLNVISSDSRILAARCQVGNLAMDFLVIYAPQRGRGDEFVKAWWKGFARILNQRDPRAMLFILGDCNCGIGSVESAAIGDEAPDVEDEGGDAVESREICETNHLFVPSTFSGWHEGSSATFVELEEAVQGLTT